MSDEIGWEMVFDKKQPLRDAMGRIGRALVIAEKYGMIDGGDHKMWVIDQMVRMLTHFQYNVWKRFVCEEDGGSRTYDWEEGVAP